MQPDDVTQLFQTSSVGHVTVILDRRLCTASPGGQIRGQAWGEHWTESWDIGTAVGGIRGVRS